MRLQLESQCIAQAFHLSVVFPDPLASELAVKFRGFEKTMRQHAPAQPVACLQNSNVKLMIFQTIGRRQSSQTRADHNAFFGLLHVLFPLALIGELNKSRESTSGLILLSIIQSTHERGSQQGASIRNEHLKVVLLEG
jgi:hypothetical protein